MAVLIVSARQVMSFVEVHCTLSRKWQTPAGTAPS
jgi:hypothetical protein